MSNLRALAYAATQDPSLDRRAAALAEERRIASLDGRGLLACVKAREARYGQCTHHEGDDDAT